MQVLFKADFTVFLYWNVKTVFPFIFQIKKDSHRKDKEDNNYNVDRQVSKLTKFSKGGNSCKLTKFSKGGNSYWTINARGDNKSPKYTN